MKLLAILLLVFVGVLVLGIVTGMFNAIINTSAWTGLELTGWENALILLTPLIGLAFLVYVGYEIVKSRTNRDD